MDLRHLPQPVRRFVERSVLRQEDEYEVYSPRTIDPQTRRCQVFFTGTQFDCRNFWHTHEKRDALRIRPTGEKI